MTKAETLTDKYSNFIGISDEEFFILKTIVCAKMPTRQYLFSVCPWGASKTDLLINKLRSDNLIMVNKIENEKRGRNPFIYEVRSDIGFFLGIELNIVYDRFVMIGMNGKLCFSKEYEPSLAAVTIQESVEHHIFSFLEEYGMAKESLWSIGIGTHAGYEDNEGIIRNFSSGGKTEQSGRSSYIPLKTYLEAELGIPVLLERPKLLVTIPDYRYCFLENKTTSVSLNLGYGVGLALFINGEYYSGVDNLAGELGHVVVPGNRRRCFCGNTGCLSTIVSYQGICEEAMAQVQLLRERGISAEINEKNIGGPDYESGVNHIIDLALENNKTSMNILVHAAVTIGQALATIISLFNPELITIYSALVRAGDVFSDPLKMALRQNAFAPALENIKTELIPLEPYAVASGGALISLAETINTIEKLRNIRQHSVRNLKNMAGNNIA